MDIPAIEQIKEHFSKAKEIRCLRLNSAVNVANVVSYTYDEKENSWNSIAGVVCFWKQGQYAEITKKKCGPDCKNCKPCREQRKAK